MINAHRTGAYISSLRKARDWTQQDLAQKLQVTHQAVSQWEKGASFPDIGLLPQLARVFSVSVDDLLNGEPLPRTGRLTRGTIVEELARGNPTEVARLVHQAPEGMTAMLEAAPLARPSQINEVVSKLGRFEFTLQQLVDLAPFVSKEVLRTMFETATFENIPAETLLDLAPFVGEATLNRLLQQVAGGPLALEQVGDLAPFLDRATLQQMVLRQLPPGQALPPEQLENLAPFLERETLEALIQRAPEGPLPIEHVVELAPFVSRDFLDRLLERVDEPGALGQHLEDLAPFLSKPALKRAVAGLKGTLSTTTLLELAPFLDKETLEDILKTDGGRQTTDDRP